MRFAFGDLGVKVCMQLTQAYRSLPRPSSEFKPSYPSSSLIGNLSSFTHIYLSPKGEMSKYGISYTVLIEYDTCRQVILKLPKPASLNSVHRQFF